jgi:hypothetical protein
MSAQPLNYYDVDKYTATKKGQVIANYGANGKELNYVFSVDDGPVVSDTDNSILVIPAGALIESCEVFITGDLSGGTSFDLGLSQPDGTVIDADGLVSGATQTTGAFFGTGVLVGAEVPANAQLTLGGDRTAGELTVVLKFKVA